MELKHTSVHIKYLLHEDFTQVFLSCLDCSNHPSCTEQEISALLIQCHFSISLLLLTMISMHSRLLICSVNKQGMFKQQEKDLKTHSSSFPAVKTMLYEGEYYSVLQWWTFPPVSCLTLLISHSKNYGNTQVCTAAWGEVDWWLVVMMFGILPTRSLLAHWSCEVLQYILQAIVEKSWY